MVETEKSPPYLFSEFNVRIFGQEIMIKGVFAF